ncbi:MAG TPA: [Fe-Fe] hydrogenase large subunit C-terminal domain-containing protein [Bacteroidales bacterium]|nr:[Fe-Fe] hydrogenase large subunit C-terminal domain-containing protein [Bacteroidales bacterium]
MQIHISVNNKSLEARKGETILNVLNRHGIRVPTLCHLDEFTPTGSCRMCVVEIAGRNELIPACSQPVEEGMEIMTHSPRVINARKTIVELLLANHPDDCLYCENNQHCELQDLAVELNIMERRFFGGKKPQNKDKSSPAIVKDNAKCILCGRCIRVCDERVQASAIDFSGRGVNTKIDTALGKGLNYSTCISCGQCILVCPSGALTEKSAITQVMDAINNPKTKIYAQLAPALGYTLAEELNFKAGTDITPLIIRGLKQAGIDVVFDSAYAGDIFVLETAQHIMDTKKSPVIISSCPAVIRYMEQFDPEALSYTNPTKTPQQILGKLTKSIYAKSKNLPQHEVFTVSITPCTAAKAEATRTDTMSQGIPDVDAVLTTRELLRLLKLSGVDLHNIDEARFNAPYHVSSSAGSLYNIPGGLSEAVFRSMHNALTGKDPTRQKMPDLRSIKQEKSAKFTIDKKKYTVKVVSGIHNIDKHLQEIISGEATFDILELSNCTMGCMGGGGQPLKDHNGERTKMLIKSLYKTDDKAQMKSAHSNPLVKAFVKDKDVNLNHKFDVS